jgi:outer membrane protein OmpA-like peptidoglycan-associated protein
VTAESVMTADGGKAARLLSDYLRITKSSSIVLTGHADSRGPDGYNLELSRKRLVAIEQFLRADGYDGGLKLVPLGESTPYQGIDRSRLPRSEVYQMDRRVELQITR